MWLPLKNRTPKDFTIAILGRPVQTTTENTSVQRCIYQITVDINIYPLTMNVMRL